eukprot:319841_1
MGGSKNETSANKKVNPELAPLITDTVAKGNQGYGDVEAQQNSQGVGGIGHNGGNLSRDKGRAGQIMVDGGDVMCLSYSWKASENRSSSKKEIVNVNCPFWFYSSPC